MSTMRDERRIYFEASGLGADGGYKDRWVWLKIGPIPLAFPNSSARVRAVQYHDLHHVVTGYKTDWVGECEISAWEIASGCKGFVAAWVLNLFAFATGCLLATKRTFTAFVRGSRSRNLYPVKKLDGVLDREVSEVTRELGLPDVVGAARLPERLSFIGWCLISFAHAVAWLFLLIVVPALLLVGWLWPTGPSA